jgi:hypothetical protein
MPFGNFQPTPPPTSITSSSLVECVWNVVAHAQKPDFVFRRNRRVHLNQQGHQFSRLLAAEVCASAVVMLDTPCSEVVKGTGYPLHLPVSPSLPLPCVTVCHHVSTDCNYTHLSGKLFGHLFFYLWQFRASYPSRQYLNEAQSFTERLFQLASWHTDVTCMSIG